MTAAEISRRAVIASIEGMLVRLDGAGRAGFERITGQIVLHSKPRVVNWRDLPTEKITELHDLVERSLPK